MHGVNHGNGSFHFDGFAIEQRRTIAPLANGIQRGPDQQRVAAQHFERLYCAIASNDRVELHRSFQVNLPRESGVNGIDAMNEQRCFERFASADGARWRFRNWRGRRQKCSAGFRSARNPEWAVASRDRLPDVWSFIRGEIRGIRKSLMPFGITRGSTSKESWIILGPGARGVL